jgi:hypothetical protein
MGAHKHVGAIARDPELRAQFKELPATYKLSTAIALPAHVALKAVAWLGYHLMTPKNSDQFRIVGTAPAPQADRAPTTARA